MITDIENDVYGVRYNNDAFSIGSRPVHFADNSITVCAKQFHLSVGLRELISKKHPSPIYTNEDLLAYRHILILTSGHKRKYDVDNPANANSSWKYRNIISKLFPPKRKKPRDSVQRSSSLVVGFNPGKEKKKLDESTILRRDKNTDPNELINMMKVKIRMCENIRPIVNTLIEMGIIRG